MIFAAFATIVATALILTCLEENVGYRQLNSFWRLEGIFQTLRKARHDWGNMQRRGFTEL